MSIADEFKRDYPIKNGEWYVTNGDFYCDKCNEQLYKGEVYLDTLNGILCGPCGIKEYNASKQSLNNIEVKIEIPLEEPKTNYKKHNRNWIVTKYKTCYFCRTNDCHHIQELINS